MRLRRPARLLAPLALVAAALAVLLVVQSDRKSSGGSTPAAAPSTQTSPGSSPTTTTTTTTAQTRTYTVKPGDTLSGIAVVTGVSLSRLQDLNPDMDAAALRTGQKLKLVP